MKLFHKAGNPHFWFAILWLTQNFRDISESNSREGFPEWSFSQTVKEKILSSQPRI